MGDDRESDPAPTPAGLRGSEAAFRLTHALGVGRWAFLVGVTKYQHDAMNLQYGRADAEALHALLQDPSCGGFQPEHMELFCDEAATTARVTSALRSFLQRPKPDDLVVLYFACHAAPDPKRPKNLYLLTHDTDPRNVAGTALPMREISLSLQENLDATRVVLLADTCYSAAVMQARALGDEEGARTVNRYLDELSKTSAGVAQLTSCAANEVSREGGEWGGGHGVFTHFLLEGLRKADKNNNGIVTVGELFDYVVENVKAATRAPDGSSQQNPSIGVTPFDRNLPMAIVGGVRARERYLVGRELLRVAIELRDRRRFEAAAEMLRGAVDFARDTFPEVLALHGQALLGASRFGDAAGAFAEAERAARARAAVGGGMPRELRDAGYWLGFAKAKAGDLTGAVAALEDFAATHPESSRAAWAALLAEELSKRGGGEGRRRALLIGIAEYVSMPPLSGPQNDVRLMREALVQRCGFRDGDVTTLANKDATRAGILAALGRLAVAAGPTDVVVVYFGGRVTSEGSDDGSAGGLVAYDFDTADGAGKRRGLVRWIDLHDAMQAIPARSKLLIHDTRSSRELIRLVSRTDATYSALLGAQPGKRTAEYPFDEGGKKVVAGLMTYALVQEIVRSGPDVRLGDLLTRLSVAMENHTAQQTPVAIGALGRALFSGRRYDRMELAELPWRHLPREELTRIAAEDVASIREPFPELHGWLGRELLDRGEYLLSRTTLERAREEAGGDPGFEVCLALASARLRSGRRDEVAPLLGACMEAAELPDQAQRIEEVVALIATIERTAPRAVLVGVDEYSGPDVPPVAGAVAGAEAMRDALTSRFGFAPSDVTLLRNGEATRERILDALRALSAAAREGPALFYFGGNGSLDEGGRPTLVSADGRKEGVFDLTLEELASLVDAAPTNLVAVLDAGWADDSRAQAREGLRFVGRDLRARPSAPLLRDARPVPVVVTGAVTSVGRVSIYNASCRYRGHGSVPARDGVTTNALVTSLTALGPDATYRQWLDDVAGHLSADDAPYVSGDALGEKLFSNDVMEARVEDVIARIGRAPLGEAAVFLRSMVEERTGNAQGQLDLGVAYERLGRLDEAARSLEEAIARKRPADYPEARYHLGRVLLALGKDLTRATSELSRAVDADPDDAAALYQLGKAAQALASQEIMATAERAWRAYLEKGAPLGHVGEVQAFLAARGGRKGT